MNALQGFYPIRERSRLTSDFKKAIEELLMTQVFKRFHLDSVRILYLFTFQAYSLSVTHYHPEACVGLVFLIFVGCTVDHG